MKIATRMVRDDEGALALMKAKGLTIAPFHERIETPLGTQFRLMFMGWRVVEETSGETRGFVALTPSGDMNDYELHADGGWCVSGARKLFHALFTDMQMRRISAKCDASNERNIRVLKRMGFVEEGRKRFPEGDDVLFGMMAGECRLLNRSAV